MSTMRCSLLSLGCVFGLAPRMDATLTALRALKIAQRRLRPGVRSKLLSMASSRTDASLVPQAWRFTFLDQATNGLSRIVTVAANASSEHPDTVRAFNFIKVEIVDSLKAIPQNKLLIDSNQALEKVCETSKLKGVQSSEYRLHQPTNGGEPVWCLSLYAKASERIAVFQVGAITGLVSFT